MAYTHTIHLKINGIDIEGEMSFNGSTDPQIKITTQDVEMKISRFNRVGSFLNQVIDLSKACGDVGKIEILKKP